MSISPFLIGKILECVAHATPYAAPETWVAVLDDTGTELSNGDYSRRRVDAPGGVSPTWSEVLLSDTKGRVEVDAAVSWGIPTVDWGKVAGFALHDANVGGNELLRKNLPRVREVFAGEPFSIPAQQLKILLAAPSV